MEDSIRAVVRQIRREFSLAFERVEDGFTLAGFVALFVMMITTTGNAVARYLFNDPITGVYELTELYLMPMAIFLMAAHLQKVGGNINVDILYAKLPSVGQTLVDLVGRVLAAVIFGPIAVWAGRRFWTGYVSGGVTVGVIEFPIYLSWFIMAVGLLALGVRLLLQIKGDLVELYRATTAHLEGEVNG